MRYSPNRLNNGTETVSKAARNFVFVTVTPVDSFGRLGETVCVTVTPGDLFWGSGGPCFIFLTTFTHYFPWVD